MIQFHDAYFPFPFLPPPPFWLGPWPLPLPFWVRPEIGPDGIDLPDEQSGGERPPLDQKSPLPELCLFSAPLTETFLPPPDPATAALAQEPAGPRPGRRPGAEASRPHRRGPPRTRP